ncbi:MAG TPA: HigA family addiction module antitoxin [Fodinibius sp.]|nr:HigA family addiction module antitoxin [Fodinibius sp.]
MTTKKLQPIHPGEVLREEFIEPMGMSQREFAEKIGVTHTRLNQIVNEKRSVTADTALRLAKALATTPEFWMNLQARYDLDQARDLSESKIEREVRPLVTK